MGAEVRGFRLLAFEGLVVIFDPRGRFWGWRQTGNDDGLWMGGVEKIAGVVQRRRGRGR